jgi:hypothetical protein
MMKRAARIWVSAMALLASLGCDYYARPHRPFPPALRLQTLDGRVLDAEALKGKPWVIRLWLPG